MEPMHNPPSVMCVSKVKYAAPLLAVSVSCGFRACPFIAFFPRARSVAASIDYRSEELASPEATR